MDHFPPEKYYEACITYHLVNQFQERFDQELFPLSISQFAEHYYGYDFEYRFSAKSFFIQYKRPIAFLNGIYSWHIDKEQLQVISRYEYPCKTYYALPAFSDMMEWYHGIEQTYFVVAPKLSAFLRENRGIKMNVLHSTSDVLRNWEDIARQFAVMQSSLFQLAQRQGITVADIASYANVLNSESRACTWGYLFKENADD